MPREHGDYFLVYVSVLSRNAGSSTCKPDLKGFRFTSFRLLSVPYWVGVHLSRYKCSHNIFTDIKFLFNSVFADFPENYTYELQHRDKRFKEKSDKRAMFAENCIKANWYVETRYYVSYNCIFHENYESLEMQPWVITVSAFTKQSRDAVRRRKIAYRQSARRRMRH
jgi:hypothetical protein